MPADIIEVFDTETQFIHETLAAMGKGPLVWSQLCHCEQQQLLAHLKRKREHVMIREAV